jgi:hypothetical protein
MSTPRRKTTRAGGPRALFAAAFWAALVLSTLGCPKAPPPPVVPKAQAPVPRKTIERASVPDVKFVDITKEAGIHFVHCNSMTGEKLLPETMGSGCAFLDYDGDGHPDLLLINQEPWPTGTAESQARPTMALYRNDGAGHFTDVTREAGLDVALFGMGVAVGDYDNDHDPDLYITTLHGGRLFRNDNGRFVDVTTESGAGTADAWLTSAAFFDMENDGDLDLFLCNYVEWSPEADRAQTSRLTGLDLAYDPPNAFGGTFCILLRNDGGKFTDVSADSGIQVRSFDLRAPYGKSLGVAPWDIDGDGLVDLAVANDTVPNFLFHNLGGGKFEEVAMISGIAFDVNGSARGAMGIDWAHFLNDACVGLAIGNFANEMTALYVSEDPRGMLFSDQANLFGLGAPTQNPLKFGLFFFDYDLDGRLDLLTANGHLETDIEKTQASMSYRQPAQLFWNTGKRGPMLFALVTPDKAGPDLFTPIVGRGSAYADIDGDGDLDLVLTENGGPARLFRNDGGNRQHGIRIRLSGTSSNHDGIGAKVELRSAGKTQRRQLFTAKGYLSSVEPELTFGLGTASIADEVVVQWPSGKTTEVSNLAADAMYLIDEGSNQATRLAPFGKP